MPRLAAGIWIAGLALCAAALAAEAFRPDRTIARASMLTLENAVPARVQGWRVEAAPPPVQPRTEREPGAAPTDQQILSRTYVDDAGRRVMLVISYGVDPSVDGLQGHRPEFCYQAQGFSVRSLGDARLAPEAGALPVRRLLAERGTRREPITYWMLVGNRAVRPGWDRKLTQLQFGLRGTIPEGLLVRVSSLDRDATSGHAVQAEFIRALLGSVDPAVRPRLAGAAV